MCFAVSLQEKTCEESTSFDLTPYEVASAIAAVDRLLVEQVKATGAGGTLAEDGSLDYDSGRSPFVLSAEVTCLEWRVASSGELLVTSSFSSRFKCHHAC